MVNKGLIHMYLLQGAPSARKITAIAEVTFNEEIKNGRSREKRPRMAQYMKPIA